MVRGLVPATPPTTYQHFSVKRCASAQNPCKVGVPVTKWQNRSKYQAHHRVKKSSSPNEKKINSTHQLHQVQTKTMKCKRIIKMEGGGILYQVLINVFLRCDRGRKNVTSVPRWWGWLVVPGLWYLVHLIRDIFCFFSVENLYLSTYVPGTYQQPWLYIHRIICKAYM